MDELRLPRWFDYWWLATASLIEESDFRVLSRVQKLGQSEQSKWRNDLNNLITLQQAIFTNFYLLTFFFWSEEALPIPGYFKMHVKIAHFSMSISAVHHDVANIFEEVENTKGIYGSIYFANMSGSRICCKIFAFENEDEYHEIFRKVV